MLLRDLLARQNVIHVSGSRASSAAVPAPSPPGAAAAWNPRTIVRVLEFFEHSECEPEIEVPVVFRVRGGWGRGWGEREGGRARVL